jgi:hypothetical protein
MNWDQVVSKITPYIVRIDTPEGSGTGFLCLYNEAKSWIGIATAAHVVDRADEWQQSIRLHHSASGEMRYVQPAQRAVLVNRAADSAVVLCQTDLKLPQQLIPLLPTSTKLPIGAEVGWLGFPSIAPDTLCFFTGNISAHQDAMNAYLIDGVAINGVSGGPVISSDGASIVGVISSYYANRATGESLPGLSVAQDVTHFHGVMQHVQSIDDAERKKREYNEILQSILSNLPKPPSGN